MTEGQNPIADNAITAMLVGLFERLADQAVDYAVMRNADGLPQRTGRDVDLVVAPEHRDRLAHHIVTAITEANGWLVEARQGRRQMHLNGVWPDGARIRFDLQWDVSHNGMVLCEAASLLANARTDPRGFRRLAKVDEVATAVLNNLLTRATVKPSYQEAARAAFDEDANALNTAFRALVGPSLAGELTGRARDGEWSDAQQLKQRVVTMLRLRVRSGLGAELNVRARRAALRARNWLRPDGPFIVILGTHGAGKTTTARALAERLEAAGYPTEYRHINSRPGVLMQLTAGGAVPAVASTPEQERYSAMPRIDEASLGPRQRLVATGRLLYHALDFVAFHGRVVLPAMRRGRAIVSDRYVYDYLVEPRGVAGSPMWLRRALSRVTPGPRLLVHLRADPAVIHARKAELPLAMLQQQIAAFDALVAVHGGVSVSVEQPPEAVCDEILRHLGPARTDPIP